VLIATIDYQREFGSTSVALIPVNIDKKAVLEDTVAMVIDYSYIVYLKCAANTTGGGSWKCVTRISINITLIPILIW